jgi:ribosome biogenesis GTPase
VTKANVIGLSSVTGAGFDELREKLVQGKTNCLLGSSGVARHAREPPSRPGSPSYQTVSATGEGTHTTTRRQLIILESGAC